MVVKADFDVALDANYHVDFDASMGGVIAASTTLQRDNNVLLHSQYA